jgi:hypothetical protein
MTAARQGLPLLLLVLLPAALLWLWYAPLQFSRLIGDDLQLLLVAREGGYAGSPQAALTDVVGGKYRPVATLALALATDAFGGAMMGYVGLNLTVLLLVNSLTAWLAYRLAGNDLLIGTLAGLAAATSRFSPYLVLQAWGLMENLALLWFVLLVAAAAALLQRIRRRTLTVLLLAYLLLIHTHERFLTAALPLTLLLWYLPADRRLPQRLAWSAAPLLIAAGNLGLKLFWLQVPVLLGTDNRMLEADGGRFVLFFAQSAATLLGVTLLPDHLIGRTIVADGWWAPAAALLLITATAALVVAARRGGARPTRPERLGLLSALLLTAVTTASAAVTIRVESRWLAAPWLLLLLVAAWLLGRIVERPRLRSGLALLMLSAVLLVDGRQRLAIDNLYFVQALRVAEQLRVALADTPAGQVVLVTGGDAAVRDWYFADQGQQQIYGGPPLTFVADRSAVTPAAGTRVFAVQQGRLQELTAALSEDAAKLLDLTAAFDPAQLADQTPVETPDGRGVFRMVSDDGAEQLVLLSGFSYRSTLPALPEGARLRLESAAWLPLGDGARLRIRLSDGAQLLQEWTLTPPVAATPQWQLHELPLGAAPAGLQLTLTVDSPGGDQLGDWIAVRHAAVLPPLPE